MPASMRFSNLPFWLMAALLAAAPLSAAAQDGATLRYEGRIKVAGKPYSGPGLFFFALENSKGEIFWTSGDYPFRGSTNNPANAIKIPVTDGAYEVRLGAATLGMPALNAQALLNANGPRLKVWFNDGVHGWQPAGSEAPLDSIVETLAAKSQSDAVLQELRAIRTLLERQSTQRAPAAPAQPTTATVSLLGPSLGQSNAPLVLVEFTDYQCAYCKRFQEQTMPDLMRRYVNTGKLRIVSRNLPLSFHPNAEPAAQAALCAEQQEKYWPMRESLFAWNTNLTTANVLNAAMQAKLDLAQFTNCVQAKTFASRVQQDSQDAGAAGINGTPSFVLGKPQGGKLTGVLIVGAQPLSEFDAQIGKLLNSH
jgi:protein-disulfide isomerase